jgi:predicted short-subunit dehydrogenase-like oxidoreductase (DUF2520 family)
MNRPLTRILASVATAAALALCAPAALACGEGMFNLGKGLPYQGYLAPRPAKLLVLDAADADAELVASLERAGHTVTVVRDREALGASVARGGIDVVIGDLDALSSLPSGPARLLPVVPKSRRDSPAVRERYTHVLVAGASLAQMLRGIHRVLESEH